MDSRTVSEKITCGRKPRIARAPVGLTRATPKCPADDKKTKTQHLVGIGDAYSTVNEALAVIDSRLVEMNYGVAYGARDLLKLANDAFYKASDTGNVDDCEAASAALHTAQQVLGVVCDHTDDLVAWGALRLAAAAKSAIDCKIDELNEEALS